MRTGNRGVGTNFTMTTTTITLGPSGLQIQVAGATSEKEIFKALGFWASDWQGTCSCGSKDVVPVHRNNGGFDYYEGKCRACGNIHQYGQAKDTGSLFPKRDKGWHKPQRGGNDPAESRGGKPDGDW